MLEKTIENKLRQAVEAAGGLCLKWTCPGRRGVPDRMILMPGGRITFVELKRPGAKVREEGLQAFWHERLRQFGFQVEVIDDAQQISGLVARLTEGSQPQSRQAHALKERERNQ